MIDYARTCFVIMPFGSKPVGEREADFDQIYKEVFVPAIASVELPEGGNLMPRRTDMDFFTGEITLEMFRYLEYSRFALTDISGLNPNVLYELGVRHRARASGTAIFRQADAPIPFDIRTIKAFPYAYEPVAEVAKSKDLIARVLRESLAENRRDSPVRNSLDAQRAPEGADAEALIKEAENAIRLADFTKAITLYRSAVTAQPSNLLARMRLGLMLRDREKWADARSQFEAAIAVDARYAEAWRELGIVKGKMNKADGEDELRQAIALNPEDFDAWASLGGILKRANQLEEAKTAYEQSVEASSGHPYPLLNAVKLRAKITGKLDLTAGERRSLRRGQRDREAQVAQTPAYDAPWCFFDLAEIRLLLDGDLDDALKLIRKGLDSTDADWQGKTFRESLELLEPAAVEAPGLHDCLELVRRWEMTGKT